jgi:hypothetical protein
MGNSTTNINIHSTKKGAWDVQESIIGNNVGSFPGG